MKRPKKPKKSKVIPQKKTSVEKKKRLTSKKKKKTEKIKVYYGDRDYIFVHITQIGKKDFVAHRGAENQNKTSHTDLYDHRDDIYVRNNYPRLSRAGKQNCQGQLMGIFKATGGRLLKQTDSNDDWYYIVPESMAREIIAAKFRPSKVRKARLVKRIEQLAFPPVAPVVQERPDFNDTTTDEEQDQTLDGNYDEFEDDTEVDDADSDNSTFVNEADAYHDDEVEMEEETTSTNDGKREIDIIDFENFFLGCKRRLLKHQDLGDAYVHPTDTDIVGVDHHKNFGSPPTCYSELDDAADDKGVEALDEAVSFYSVQLESSNEKLIDMGVFDNRNFENSELLPQLHAHDSTNHDLHIVFNNASEDKDNHDIVDFLQFTFGSDFMPTESTIMEGYNPSNTELPENGSHVWLMD